MGKEIYETKAPKYKGDMPLNMKIDQLIIKLGESFPELSWDECLVEARKLMKIHMEV